MSGFGPVLANGTILWIIAVVVGLNRDRLGSATPLLMLALLLINLLGYAAGWIGGLGMRLPVPMRRALTLEIGMQNAGLGTALVLSLFPNNPAAAIPTAAYTFGCMFTGTLLAQFWNGRPVEGSALDSGAEPLISSE
jgi:BASS family bile acid:Na+ symporter